ncbi:hypothetical protein NP493_1578g00005 [Ridgeia piscesae]|uniref:Uncharacterized protein n=1 Tax=Ridgeia piscesae TaxID=27915 RepID=A0AAD9N962_RIDPI|nr:hypothetical protein NP493_1578g00005 [Ridgeia piscesae]
MRGKKDPDKEFTELCDLEDVKVLKEKRKGNAEFKDEKYGSALSSYTNGLCRSLYNYILYGNRSLAHLKLGKNWEAMCDGFRCVVLKPDWPKGQYRYAEAWYNLGKLDKAITVVQTAITLNPKDQDLRNQENRFITERKKRKRPSSKSRTTNGYDQKSASCQTDSVYQFSGKDQSQTGNNADRLVNICVW